MEDDSKSTLTQHLFHCVIFFKPMSQIVQCYVKQFNTKCSCHDVHNYNNIIPLHWLCVLSDIFLFCLNDNNNSNITTIMYIIYYCLITSVMKEYLPWAQHLFQWMPHTKHLDQFRHLK